MTAPTSTLDAEQPGRWATASRAQQEVNGPERSGARPSTPSNAEVEPRPRGSLGTPAGPSPRPAGSPAAPAPSGAAGPATHCARCNRPRLLGIAWCGKWCSACLNQWITDGQPAPAATGRIGRTYRYDYDRQASA